MLLSATCPPASLPAAICNYCGGGYNLCGCGLTQLFISQMRLIKTYGHEGIRDTSHWFVSGAHERQNDRDSADYILGTTAQSEAAKVAK